MMKYNVSKQSVKVRKLFAWMLSFIICSGILTNCDSTDSKLVNRSQVKETIAEPLNKPFRVLVIIGDQWTDPFSYNIDTRRVRGTEFIDIITMLKIWGIPFDILRLDEQRLQINRFLDGLAKPNYGCVIWMADPDKLTGYSANYQVLKRVVEEYGISMITLFDNIKVKEIADLAGINYKETRTIELSNDGDRFVISGNHFITKGAEGVILPDKNLLAHVSIPGADFNTSSVIESEESKVEISFIDCTISDSVKVLGKVGDIPQMVVRDVSNKAKVIWIGGAKDWFRKYPVMREIFRESLVYAIGYGVFNDNFENGYIFIMDDVGCSEHAWSLRWHYPTPSRETLIKYLIEPLEKRGLMMVINSTPGYANPETRMIEDSWSVKPFTDIFGNWQDYGSTKEGLQEGLKRGVFEIQTHRAWSHMNWDLDSPPGPWWDKTIDGEIANTDWYNEVVDVRRGATPVPSNDLLFIYRAGIDAVKKTFGVTALAAEVRPAAELREGTHGGDDNGRVAAIAGLGVSRECYVGIDWTIEFSMMMPEQFTCHDLDLTAKTDSPGDTTDTHWDVLLGMTTEQLLSSKIAGGRRINLLDNTNWIEANKDKYWMGFNECCAYLHSRIVNGDRSKFAIEFNYDNHYCNYFEKKKSHWTLEFSDDYLNNLGPGAVILIDGKKIRDKLTRKQVIEIPEGIGTHTISII
jgi:hypothetical protein